MEFAISNSIKIHPLALVNQKVTDKAVTDQISINERIKTVQNILLTNWLKQFQS
jgi:hypothetical protein